MRTTPPAVPYHATAHRPGWAELPAGVRSGIEQRLGAPVAEARSAGGGFTRGFAAVLRTTTGGRAFVKAAPAGTPVAAAYAREAEVTVLLPADVPAARLRWTATVADWYAICLDPVDGHMPRLPWDPAELDAALAAWAAAAAALRHPPPGLLALGLPAFADIAASDLGHWQPIAAHQAPLPGMPGYARGRLDELAALEATLPRHTAGAAGVTHCDLRLDNVLVDPAGRAWICDWNWVCTGPAWVDTAALLVTAYASGLDADGLFAAHPTARAVPAEALDALLAGLAGFWLVQSGWGPSDASPALRGHQRWSGEASLAWLARRRSWPVLAGSCPAW
ncbi:MAG TPA: phosphotransferase [Micromonosporaceae bacterium]|nr:phosphotransferase [Micromonosporaceae bacterium]